VALADARRHRRRAPLQPGFNSPFVTIPGSGFAQTFVGLTRFVSLLQPVRDSGTSAVFLRKSDLRPELQHPLHDTLPLASPPVATAGNPKEAAVIDALTLQSTFPAHFEPLPDGDAILVLDVAQQTPTQ
jgi:hypothetical protein